MSKIKIVILFFFFLPSVMFFQNCSEQQDFATESLQSLSRDELIVNHGDDFTLSFKSKAEVAPQMFNRIYMTNLFISIFGTNLRQEYLDNMGWNANDFGSGYSAYNKVHTANDNCKGDSKSVAGVVCRVSRFPATVAENGGVNTRREAYRMHMCHISVRNNGALMTAIRKLGQGDEPEINDQNIGEVFSLFFRGKPPATGRVLDSLKLVADDEDNNKDKWRAIFLATCLSPHWQVM